MGSQVSNANTSTNALPFLSSTIVLTYIPVKIELFNIGEDNKNT
jgi:hypothetical protein